MKKLTLILAGLMVMAFSFTSCSTPEEQIKAGVEEANKDLPQEIEGAGKMTQITYNESSKELSYVIELNDDMAAAFALVGKSATEEVKTSMVESLKGDSEVKPLMDALKELGGSLKVSFQSNGKEIMGINYKTDEL